MQFGLIFGKSKQYFISLSVIGAVSAVCFLFSNFLGYHFVALILEQATGWWYTVCWQTCWSHQLTSLIGLHIHCWLAKRIVAHIMCWQISFITALLRLLETTSHHNCWHDFERRAPLYLAHRVLTESDHTTLWYTFFFAPYWLAPILEHNAWLVAKY